MTTYAIPRVKVAFKKPSFPPATQWIDWIVGMGLPCRSIDGLRTMFKDGEFDWLLLVLLPFGIWLYMWWAWNPRWRGESFLQDLRLPHSEGRKERLVWGAVAGVPLGILLPLFAEWVGTAILIVLIAEAIIIMRGGGGSTT